MKKICCVKNLITLELVSSARPSFSSVILWEKEDDEFQI
jgi:hypothetical protein